MSSTVLAPYAKQQFFDNNGVPLAGGKLFTYQAGSTTKLATYTDFTGNTPNANPIILDSAGRASIWLTPSTAYKFVLSPSTDTDPPTNPIWTVDNINAPTGQGVFVESSVATNQSVSAGNSGTNYIATAAVTLTIAKSTTLSTTWQIQFYAQAGAITIAPNAADQINGGTAGASVVFPRGSAGSIATDANGNLYITPIFGSTASPQWVAAGGTADAITASYQPTVTALYDGLTLAFRATAANATSTPTFAPDSQTAHTITKQGGVAVLAGDIPGNLAEVILRYNLSSTRWELLNPANGKDQLPTAGGTANALTLTLSPAASAYYAGMRVFFIASAANTGATTININSLGAKNIFKAGASGPTALQGGEIQTSQAVEVVYDGTQFNMIGRGALLGPRAGTVLTKNPYATATTTAVAHGLGQAPDYLKVRFTCLTGEGGYTAGQVIDLSASMLPDENATNFAGYALLVDATNVTLITGTQGISLPNALSGALFTTTANNWRIDITPYAFL